MCPKPSLIHVLIFLGEKKCLAFPISGKCKSVTWISSCLLLYAYRDVIVLTRGICSFITFYLFWKSLNWVLKLQWTLLNTFPIPTGCLKCTVALLCCVSRGMKDLGAQTCPKGSRHMQIWRGCFLICNNANALLWCLGSISRYWFWKRLAQLQPQWKQQSQLIQLAFEDFSHLSSEQVLHIWMNNSRTANCTAMLSLIP